jgi:putative nucleotidyltransferase with HDIG domain
MDPDIIQSLVRTIELKDHSTAAHTWRVVLYTRAMAENAGLDKPLIERLSIAAALHDIGKIDIPDDILTKPARLTAEEFEVIKTHTTLGHERLTRMGETDEHILALVRHHHERWDGLGYPDGLADVRIPIGPRFFAVIDSFDAMTSIRPYRDQIGEDAAERALLELESGKGTRYWPEAVDAFTDLYRSETISWILNYFNDEVPVEDFDPAG